MTEAKRATKIRDLEEYRGDAALYRLEPAYEGNEFVMVSTVHENVGGVYRVDETYAFPADAAGEVTDWAELDCSRKGHHTHADILANAGYVVEDA